MFDEYKYKFEMHCHTSPVSSCSEVRPIDLINNYHAIGVDGIVITNHFTPDLKDRFTSDEKALDYYFNDYEIAKAEGEKLGMTVLYGLEMRFTENCNDYLLYGIDKSDAKTVLNLLSSGIVEFRKQYKNERSVFIQAHPCRNGIELIDLGLVDGIEAFNMHPGHNSRIAFSAKMVNQNNMIGTCGTDYHHLTHEGSGLIRFKTTPKDNYELADIIKSGDYIFDINGFLVLPPKFISQH